MTKYKPGDRVVITATCTSAFVDKVLSDMSIAIWVGVPSMVCGWKVVNPIEIERYGPQP